MTERNKIICGDCLTVMAGMEENSVEAVVTDPPYGLKFMGKQWDHGVPGVPFWTEALRVAKPGAHLLAFGGTRTYHRLVCAVEDAGWEIRDTIGWIYGSGFPKSLAVDKSIDKAAGAEREVVGTYQGATNIGKKSEGKLGYSPGTNYGDVNTTVSISAPTTEAAKKWDGWGTGLKPAMEMIVVARKPLIGTGAENVLEYGTGAINVDGCRVIVGKGREQQQQQGRDGALGPVPICGPRNAGKIHPTTQGRWPANLIHDGSEEVVGLFPDSKSTGGQASLGAFRNGDVYGKGKDIREKRDPGLGDQGSNARFFYAAKASKKERGEGNKHPTVKPVALMRYLCRLVTPPDGLILDPFCGSGSTGVAALREGFRFIGIDKEPEYVEIARARIERALHIKGKPRPQPKLTAHAAKHAEPSLFEGLEERDG